MFGLSFLAPAFLLGLAAAVGPVLMHLFAREAAPITTLPTMRFVPRAPVQHTRRRRLQDLWLLLCRIGAVALLAVAFARPFLARPAATPTATLGVVAVDTSFSMAGRERQRLARELAKQAVDAMPSGVPVALLAFDSGSRVVVAPTTIRGDVKAAIDQLPPGYGSTSYGAAVRGALEITRRRPARLVLVTDGQRAGISAEVLPLVPPSLDVSMRMVPAPASNLSVDALERVDTGVVAAVRNHGREPAITEVVWAIDGAPAGRSRITIGADETGEVRLDRGLPARAVVSATVDDPQGYEADNRRYAVTDPIRPLRVLVVTGADNSGAAAFYLQTALAASSERAPMSVIIASAGDPRLVDGSALRDARVIVVVGTRGLERSVRRAIGAAIGEGRGLLVVAGPDVEVGVAREWFDRRPQDVVEDLSKASRERTLVATEARHPVLAALGVVSGNLGQVRVERAWDVRQWGDATTLLRLSTGEPALSEVTVGSGRAFLLSTDLGRRWNTWPLHPTFAPFCIEAIRYLGGERVGNTEVLVGATSSLDTASPGVQERAGTEGGRVAINVDPRESGVQTVEPAAFLGSLERLEEGAVASSLAVDEEGGSGLWRWCFFALLAVLAVESLIASRPRTARARAADGVVGDGYGEGRT